MPRNRSAACSLLFCFGFLFSGLWLITECLANTPLDHSNLTRTGDRAYWDITREGSYYLAVPESHFSTNNYYAIRIRTSNVVLDGRGKTLTGTGSISTTDNRCGILVNGGPQLHNVQIKNVNVEKKFHGILFEWIKNGRVENCNVSGNVRGVTLWGAEQTTLYGNTANNNREYGLELDGHNYVNRHNSLIHNTVNNNALAGIIFHLVNAHNTISGNTANGNGHFGITLPNGSHDNTLTENTTTGNPTGILIRSAPNNIIRDNTITGNRDKGLWLYDASNNTIYNNYFNNSVMNVGFEGSCSGNRWNITKTPGVNIVGGSHLGGNYWATPEGTGFSQVTRDSNGDGFCDEVYSIRAGDVDHLPLKKVQAVLPTIVTASLSEITSSSAAGGGSVTSSGGASVSARGVCWSVQPNPGLNDSHTIDGSGTGTFLSRLTGLNPDTSYYVRAYAVSSVGTAYGASVSFKTQPFSGVAYVVVDITQCGNKWPCFNSLQEAIDSSYAPHTLHVALGTHPDDVVFRDQRAMRIEGGWAPGFTHPLSGQTFIKAPVVRGGPVTLLNLIVLPQED